MTKTFSRKTVAFLAAFAFAAPALSDDVDLVFDSFSKLVVPGPTGGQYLVMPTLTQVDSNQDGIPELQVKARVFQLHTNTLVQTTKTQSMPWPAITACLYGRTDYDINGVKILGTGNAVVTAVSLNTESEGQDCWREAGNTLIYYARIDGSNVSWAKKMYGGIPMGFEQVLMDDGTPALMLFRRNDVDEQNSSAVVTFFKESDGTLISQKTYNGFYTRK